MMTILFGLLSSFQTPSISGCGSIDPVGHTLLHCPQSTHSTSASPLLNAGATIVLAPLPTKSIAPIPCIS